MKLKMCRTQSVIALLALYVGLAQSWDLAVSHRDQLKFYTNDILTSTIKFKFHSLTALAYDNERNRILYVDRNIIFGDAICGYTISTAENSCFTERAGRIIHGIAYDSSTETIFFTDTSDRTVNTFSLKSGSQNNAKGNLLIRIDEGIPRDIIVDSCKRHVYWLTTDNPQPTIERARFDGTEREVFQTLHYYLNLFCKSAPHSLTIDPKTQKIYWYEPFIGEHRCYSSSVLDKNQKTFEFSLPRTYAVCYHPTNTVTVSNRYIYSVDFRFKGANFFKFDKDQLLIPGEISRYINATPLKIYNWAYLMIPVGIVAKYQITEEDQDCEIF